MARDYKTKTKRKPKKRSSGSKSDSGSSPWTFLASGFGLGLVAALVLYLQLRPQELAAPDRPIPNASVAPQSSTESEPVTVVSEKTPVVVTEAVKPPPVSAPIESDYDFYNVLPDFEVVIADEDNKPVVTKPAGRKPSRPAETPGKPATYILQAGSFRKFIDADRQKAKLAFKGIESKIQQVVLKEGDTWFRVYVGPNTDFASLENMRSELRRANIDVLILKVRQ